MTHDTKFGEDPPNSVLVVPNEFHVQATSFNPKALALWAIVIASGLIMEAVGLRSTSDDWPPLTHIIVAYIPWPIAASFIAWLKSHFTQAYGYNS